MKENRLPTTSSWALSATIVIYSSQLVSLFEIVTLFYVTTQVHSCVLIKLTRKFAFYILLVNLHQFWVGIRFKSKQFTIKCSSLLLSHLHDKGIVLQNFDTENFMFDDEKLILVSLQNAIQSKNAMVDISGFVTFINSIKGNYSGLDLLLAQCIPQKMTSKQILAELHILAETEVFTVSRARGHQRTTSGNSSNESNGTEMTSLSYFSDYRSDVFYYSEANYKNVHTYINL